ncbi:hypothetical protein DFAR_3060013 [Desulfarculales bacterium]
MMDPLMIAYLAKFGIDAVTGIIKAWQESGQPTPDQIRAAFITKRPEDYFKRDQEVSG